MASENDSQPDNPHWAPNGALWGGINHLLRNKGLLSSSLDCDAADATQSFLREHCPILIIGAGGLGCELLKDVALSGFRNIHIIDLDIIDLTNLNRQFLFRKNDVGKPKAVVAAKFVNDRVPGVKVTPYHDNITNFDADFYRQFTMVIAGLDSIPARRWLNAMLVNLVQFDDNGEINQSTVIPLIDGGTEGFQGQARIIYPKFSSCFECTLSLFPPARNFPLCTIANTPRLPEHCIQYANVVMWNEQKPFDGTKLDTDNPDHMNWLYTMAKDRAERFGIDGVTYRLTQGVTKNIIPAVAATNAIIAAACANEALKMITFMAKNMDNYMMYNGNHGVYTFTYRNEKKPDCPVCGAPTPKTITAKSDSTLAEFLEQLAADPDIQSQKPFLRTDNGKTLYASAPPSIQQATASNLGKRLGDLIVSGVTLTLADKDLPFVRTLHLNFK